MEALLPFRSARASSLKVGDVLSKKGMFNEHGGHKGEPSPLEEF